MELNTDTKQKILRAATEIFLKKGHDGARMQEIADNAGINKALLHYYFRSKQKLFRTVFKIELQSMLASIFGLISPSDNFEEFLETIFDEIKDDLVSRQSRVEKYLEKFESKSEILVKDILKETKLDKVSLMFILAELKENKLIYGFNGRDVTLI